MDWRRAQGSSRYGHRPRFPHPAETSIRRTCGWRFVETAMQWPLQVLNGNQRSPPSPHPKLMVAFQLRLDAVQAPEIGVTYRADVWFMHGDGRHLKYPLMANHQKSPSNAALGHSLFKADVAEHRPWKSWLPLIFLVWVVRRWLQIVLVDAIVSGGLFQRPAKERLLSPICISLIGPYVSVMRNHGFHEKKVIEAPIFSQRGFSMCS